MLTIEEEVYGVKVLIVRIRKDFLLSLCSGILSTDVETQTQGFEEEADGSIQRRRGSGLWRYSKV